MNLTATMKSKVMYISSLVRKTVGMLTYRIKMPTTGLAHFIRNLKKQKWEKYNGRALVFCFFVCLFCFCLFLYKVSCTSFKKYLNRYIWNIQFILQNILKNVIGVHFNATLNRGNCFEMLVAPVLYELESVQALAMPAEVLAPHVAGPQSQGEDEDRTLKQ